MAADSVSSFGSGITYSHANKIVNLRKGLAVEPTGQNKAIGTALVRAGLEQCKDLGYGAVVVLGHPRYYPHFGFCLQRALA